MSLKARTAACNAYLHRAIPHIRTQRTLLTPPCFTSVQVQSLLKFHPKNPSQYFAHLILLTLLDTGARISEVLSLRRQDCDFNNLLLSLNSKGRKARIVPFSIELRRRLYAHLQSYTHDAIFSE